MGQLSYMSSSDNLFCRLPMIASLTCCAIVAVIQAYSRYIDCTSIVVSAGREVFLTLLTQEGCRFVSHLSSTCIWGLRGCQIAIPPPTDRYETMSRAIRSVFILVLIVSMINMQLHGEPVAAIGSMHCYCQLAGHERRYQRCAVLLQVLLLGGCCWTRTTARSQPR
jgi:hypothetical protein